MRRLLVLAVAFCGLLSGCATLPQSGPVRLGDPDVTEPGSIALLARLPEPDDTPVEIVDGFLRAAAAGLTDDFTIAREFLVGPARSTWDPLARVSVYGGQPVLEADSDADSVAVSTPVSATIDRAGRYTEAQPGASTLLAFGLVQNKDGHWRIRSLDDGVLLSEPIFRSLFQQVPLYFAAPDAGALVAETRWFPRRAAETAAVRGLLDGPSPWLEPGAVTRFPPGTRLVVDTVTVRDGVAQVLLSAEALAASPEDRGLMLAQLTETLNPLPRVQSVVASAGGSQLESVVPPLPLVVDPSVGTSPVVLAEGHVRAVEGNELVPWGESGPVTVPDPSSPAVPFDDGPPVVLSRGTSVVTVPAEGEEPTTLLTATSRLTAPSYDRMGWVWVAPLAGGPAVSAVRTDGTAAEVAADWLDGREVRSLRISRDGARALVLSAVGGLVSVDVAAVVRDASGTPSALGTPLRIGQRVTSASTAAWVDAQTVALLGQVVGTSGSAVVLAVVGGPSSAVPAVDAAVGLAAGKGDRQLFLSTVGGDLFARNGLGWTPTVQDVRDPAFPG